VVEPVGKEDDDRERDVREDHDDDYEESARSTPLPRAICDRPGVEAKIQRQLYVIKGDLGRSTRRLASSL
jgi:hypothetical protein